MSGEKRARELSTTQIIAVGFLAAVLIGTLLLCIPAASADGSGVSFVTALFTATTSVCVTGLTVVSTFSSWSLFGQIIILLLIQLGGLGVVAFSTSILLLLRKRVTLKDRLLLEEAFNMNTLSGLVSFLRKVLLWTFAAEVIGALCYMPSFIPRFGARGIWISFFTAVSAFCNAGIDIIGPSSLIDYAGNVWVNVVTMLLVFLGGVGFIVWNDVARVIKLLRSGEIRWKHFLRRLSLHSKLTLSVSVILIFGGAALVMLFEYGNAGTIGDMPFGQKLLASLFQSVTTRTAGFATIPQDALRDPTSVVCMLLFFIGGSSVGTAGGVKTTSAALVFLYALSTARGTRDVSIFRRTLSPKVLQKALGVVMISFITALAATVTLSAVSGGDFIDVAFETFSAVGTVGLTRNFTGNLNTAGKLLIVLCMYLGRIGPITMAIAFGKKRGAQGIASYAAEDVTVG